VGAGDAKNRVECWVSKGEEFIRGSVLKLSILIWFRGRISLCERRCGVQKGSHRQSGGQSIILGTGRGENQNHLKGEFLKW